MTNEEKARADEHRVREILARVGVALRDHGHEEISLREFTILEALVRAIIDTTPCSCAQLGVGRSSQGCQVHNRIT